MRVLRNIGQPLETLVQIQSTEKIATTTYNTNLKFILNVFSHNTIQNTLKLKVQPSLNQYT